MPAPEHRGKQRGCNLVVLVAFCTRIGKTYDALIITEDLDATKMGIKVELVSQLRIYRPPSGPLPLRSNYPDIQDAPSAET